MMKATIKINNNLIIEVEGEEQKDLFREISNTYEVFNESRCGLCGCTYVRPVTRKNKDGDEFFEFQCFGSIEEDGKKQRCGAYLSMGQNKKGGSLFPIRMLDEKGKPSRENGKYGKHYGWTRYRGEPK